MPVSPYAGIDDPTVFLTVNLNGKVMNDIFAIQSIQVDHCVNKISMAELVLIGEVDIGSNSITITDSAEFIPGVNIEILAGYGSDATSIFTGIIVRHTVNLSTDSYYSLRILCKHAAVKMTYNIKDGFFAKKKDSDIINEVIANYGLNCSVKSTETIYENVYQKMGTDWDFVLSRCDFNGMIITQDGTAINCISPDFSSSPVLIIEAGESIISFEGTVNGEYQPSGVAASAWDAKTLALIKSTAAEPTLNAQGNIPAKNLPGMLEQKALGIISTTPMPAADLKTWAEGILLRKRLNAIKGRVKFQGSPRVKTGNLITIGRVGTRLNGDAFVSAVSHTIEAGTWLTTVEFGLENNPIHQSPDFSFAPAGGQLPAIQGIHLAKVKKIDADPESNYRVQVELPSLSASMADTWVRMAGFYATGNAGSFFLPEIGDEVVVGFFDNDPRFPVILGSLYNGKNASPYSADAKNSIKAIVTKSLMKLEFNDEKKIITLVTPGNNTIIISDDAKSIEITDQNNNSIKLESGGITMTSPKDINIKATGNINMNATGKINVSATQDLALTGLNVAATAQVGFTGKGNATAEVSASGQTAIKGAMVMIN